MATPRDIKDRAAKRLLRHRRMIRDMLDFVPRAWVDDVDPGTLRELPSEFVGRRGEKRVGDVLWLADRRGGERLLVMAEHQSGPDAAMAARVAAQAGLLYSGFAARARDADGLLPTLLPLVLHTGPDPWNAAGNLAETMAASAVPLPLRSVGYRLLDFRMIASEHPFSANPAPANRFAAWTNVTCAASAAEAAELLRQTRAALDMSDQDDASLLKDLLAWVYAQTPDHEPEDWYPDKARPLEELMSELSILQINERRLLERTRQEGREEVMAQQRSMLVRQAERRFGPETGRRLGDRLASVSDPVVFEKAGDLIVDCDDGEQLLDGINGTPRT